MTALDESIAAGQAGHLTDSDVVHKFINRWKDVKQWGATGDGTTDDSAAISAAISAAGAGGIVWFPKGTYRAANVTVSTSVKLINTYATVKKNANGPIFIIEANGVECHNMILDGEGATHTGVGIQVSTASTDGNDFRFVGGQIMDTASYAIEFSQPDKGLRGLVAHCTLNPTSTSTYGVKFPTNESNGGRTLIGVFCAGGRLVDLDGADDSRVIGCNTTHVAFGADCTKVHLVGNRIANSGITLDVQGTQHAITGNIFAGTTANFTAATRSIVQGNVWPSSTTFTLDSSCQYNLLDVSGESLTVTDNATAGFNTVRHGDGSVTAHLGPQLITGNLELDGDFNHDGSNVGFYGTAPTTKPTVTGSRGANAALASLLTALAGLGLLTDSSS